MLKPLLYSIILFACWAGPATAQVATAPAKKITERYYQLIDAPTSPAQWDAWRLALRAWKDSVLASVRYTGENYRKAEYKWASGAYATLFLMANDNRLYDPKGNYDIKNCLQQYEENYGGVDVVVLWPRQRAISSLSKMMIMPSSFSGSDPSPFFSKPRVCAASLCAGSLLVSIV